MEEGTIAGGEEPKREINMCENQFSLFSPPSFVFTSTFFLLLPPPRSPLLRLAINFPTMTTLARRMRRQKLEEEAE
jgi:hypothetical protein